MLMPTSSATSRTVKRRFPRITAQNLHGRRLLMWKVVQAWHLHPTTFCPLKMLKLHIAHSRNHTSTVILIVRLTKFKVSAAQEDSRMPIVVLSSFYLWFASLFWRVTKRLRTLTCFRCSQHSPSSVWPDFLSLIFCKLFVDATDL